MNLHRHNWMFINKSVMDGVFIFGVNGFAIAADASHPNNATEFMRMALSIESQSAFTLINGGTPSRRDALPEGLRLAASGRGFGCLPS